MSEVCQGQAPGRPPAAIPDGTGVLWRRLFLAGFFVAIVGVLAFFMIDSKRSYEVAHDSRYEKVRDGFTVSTYRQKSVGEITTQYLRSQHIPDDVINELLLTKAVSPAARKKLNPEQLRVAESTANSLQAVGSGDAPSRPRFSLADFVANHWLITALLVAGTMIGIGSIFRVQDPVQKCFSCGFVRKVESA